MWALLQQKCRMLLNRKPKSWWPLMLANFTSTATLADGANGHQSLQGARRCTRTPLKAIRDRIWADTTGRRQTLWLALRWKGQRTYQGGQQRSVRSWPTDLRQNQGQYLYWRDFGCRPISSPHKVHPSSSAAEGLRHHTRRNQGHVIASKGEAI